MLQGRDSLLHQSIVQEKGYSGRISGGINAGLGNMFDYCGPMLWTADLIHDSDVDPETILSVVDGHIGKLVNEPVDKETLDRVMIKMRSGFYNTVGSYYKVGLIDLLACFSLFDDRPELVNTVEEEFKKVTPDLIQETAKQYLRPENRTVLTVIPGAEGDGKGGEV